MIQLNRKEEVEEMTRDELLDNISKEVKTVLPENEELSGDDLETVETTVEEVLQNAADALDEGEATDSEPE